MRKFKFNGELEVTDKISGGVRDLINTIYPVGISLEFKLDVNPNTAWPWQTWVEWGQGCVIVGAGTHSDGTTSKTFALGDSAGEYKHKLTVAEMPAHFHSMKSWYTGDVSHNTTSFGGGGIPETSYRSAYNPARPFTETSGESAYHDNVQPYAVAKRWTRTA